VECRCDGRAIITVADRGPGIPPDRIEAMFEPFVRGETSRSRATGAPASASPSRANRPKALAPRWCWPTARAAGWWQR
jgi:hypothetical protein